MKIKCLHGYFIFEETRIGQVSDFMSYTGFRLEPIDGYYTFEALVDAPYYSLEGKNILNFTADVSHEGMPWDVFEANEVVYDFKLDEIKKISSVTQVTKVKKAGNRFLSPGLILPGSLTKEGNRVRDYSAWFSRDRLTFLYSMVNYV